MKNSAEKTAIRLSWFINVQRLRYKIYKITLWQTLVTKGGEMEIFVLGVFVFSEIEMVMINW